MNSILAHIVFFLVFLFVVTCEPLPVNSETADSGVTIKPPFYKKAETARWLTHTNIWGTLSTTSIHLKGQAWGQPISFVDGTKDNSTGVMYFYNSALDVSVQDFIANPAVAMSVTMAQRGMCTVNHIDPEDPRCARAVFSGNMVKVTDSAELSFAMTALFQRHPAMSSWPTDHDWFVYKLDISEIWLLDIYGGSSIVPVDEYYAVVVKTDE